MNTRKEILEKVEWMNQKKNVRKRSANPMRKWWLEAILIALPASPPGDGGAAASASPVHTHTHTIKSIS